MKINYRQGVLNHQTSPFFLHLTNGDVFIRANSEQTLISLAFGDTDFLYAETEDVLAWKGPFASPTWLYWDIDLTSGVRTFGKTTKEPLVDDILPDNPATDQHVFLRSTKKMMVWNGFRWKTVARVFAGVVESGNVTAYNVLSSQGGLNYPARAGFLLFDEDGELIRTKNGTPLNTESTIVTQSSIFNSTSLSANITEGKAKFTAIPKFRCVSWVDADNVIEVTSPSDLKRCNGITLETAQRGERARIITQGYITDLVDFKWEEPPNTPIYVGPGGGITTKPPQSKSVQKLGYIVDAHTIYVKIDPLVLIEPVVRG